MGPAEVFFKMLMGMNQHGVALTPTSERWPWLAAPAKSPSGAICTV